MNEAIFIHTDGSANKEKTLGGWAFCLSKNPTDKPFHKDSGAVKGTHNTAELSAVLNALSYVYGNHPECRKVTVFTDSQYVSDPIYFDSLTNWEAKGWKTNAGKPVANLEVWKEIKWLLNRMRVRKIDVDVRWIKGHNGNRLNEQMDRMAGNAVKNNFKNPIYG